MVTGGEKEKKCEKEEWFHLRKTTYFGLNEYSERINCRRMGQNQEMPIGLERT